MLNDKTDSARFTKCSSMDSCYIHATKTYDNNMCEQGTEKCARWLVAVSGEKKLLEGCVSSTFCDGFGYWRGQGVFYKCVEDIQDTTVVEEPTEEELVKNPELAFRLYFEPEAAKRWISNDDANELYLRGSFGITVSYLVLSIIASYQESIRAT